MASLLAVADWLPPNELVDPDHAEFIISLALGMSAIAVAMRERLEAEVVRRIGQRAILLVVTLILAVGAAEPLTRWVFRDVTTTSDNSGFFSRRWYRTGPVALNAWGFRGPSFQAAKPAGTFRIAVVGDSFTYGNGIAQHERYTDLLRARLPEHFEVLNFGVAGANTPEHRAMIDRLLVETEPDFILLQWYVNDMEDDDTADRPASRPLMPSAMHRWLSDRSALYVVANNQWAQTQVRLGMTEAYPAYLHRRLGDPESPHARIDRSILEDLIASSQRAGVPIGIVLFPDTAGDLGKDYPFGYLHQRVLDSCGKFELTCLDLRADFAAVRERRLLWANRLDHHPSALANQIAAQKILDTYAAKWAASPSR